MVLFVVVYKLFTTKKLENNNSIVIKESPQEWLISEMDICRKYCSAILREREKIHNSKKYPLIYVKINRYFLPEFREIIADECNLIGYMDIQPVEYWFEVEPYDKTNKIEVWVDDTKSGWQEEIYQKRVKERDENEKKKLLNSK